MPLSSPTRVRMVLGLSLIALGAVMLLCWQSAVRSHHWTKMVEHTHRVLAKVETGSALLRDAAHWSHHHSVADHESASSLLSTVDALECTLEDLRPLVADNADRRRQLDALQHLMATGMGTLRETIGRQIQNSPEGAPAVIGMPGEIDGAEQIRTLLQELEREERQLLELMMAEQDAAARASSYTLGVGGLLAFVLVALAAGMAERYLAERTRTEKHIKMSIERLRRTVDGTIDAMARITEIRDPYTAGHQRHVSELACSIAAEMAIAGSDLDAIRVAGAVHDLGKIAVPAEVLSRPARLTELEMELVRTHPQAGHDILKAIEFDGPVAEMVLQHHERMDGSGYPAGLRGEETLLGARILAVADVVDAMCSHRPHRPAPGLAAAHQELLRNRGNLYDPDAVDACLALFGRARVDLEA